MKVLIADDNRENLYMLETLMKGDGHEVLPAADGLEALNLLKSSGADCVISDILMSRMDGFQLCRAVREDEELKNIPFIFYTATYVSEKDREFALSLGADYFFVKPDDIEMLHQTINSVLAKLAAPVEHPLGDEMEFFRRYNQVLFGKLEKKIGQLQAAEQASQARLHQVNAILNNIPDIAWLKDTESRFIAVNAPFGRACGHGPEELAGKTDLDIWPEDLATLYRADDREVMRTGNRKRVEERLVGPGGRETWIETIKTPVFDSQGQVIGTTGIARDITDRKRAESEKEFLEEQLRQAQKMEAIGNLAGGIAHDFNNILSTIMGCSSLAIIGMKPDDPTRHYVDQILEACNRATVLTQSLLAFGRKQVVNLKRLDLNEVVLGFEKFLRHLLRENIELKVIASEAELPIFADRGQIEQVLMNLITNARDAMPEEGRIVVQTKLLDIDQAFIKDHGFGQTGQYALLTVTDSGVGIPEDIKDKIFDPFFTTKEQGKGTGLGLSMVFGIVKKHQGQIEVISKQGFGATFKIYLPVERSVEKPADCKPEEASAVKGGTETILVAEDDENLRKLILAVLGHYGYKAIEAVNGMEAIDRFSELRDNVKLVILDGIMPQMGGSDAWQEIHALKPGVKVIFISGYPDANLFNIGIPENQAAFIQKPILPTVLLKKVREILDA